MLSGVRVRQLMDSKELIFSGGVRGNGLLLSLGSPMQPFRFGGAAVDPRDRQSILNGYGSPVHRWTTYDLAFPGGLLVAAREHLSLPPYIGGMIGTLSHVARLGVFAHYSSPFVAPRYSGHLCLELANLSGHPITLYEGMPVAKVMLFAVDGNDPALGSGAVPFYYNTVPGEAIDLRSRYSEEFFGGTI